MAVTATRTITIGLSGDVTANIPESAADNANASGNIQVVALASGANTITAPVVTGVTNKGVVIVPPSGNTTLITLKGVTGDTGVALHKTDPTSVAIDTTTATFVLTAAGTIQAVRLIWT